MAPTKPGDIVRYEEPSRPWSAAIVIVILTALEMVLVLALAWTLITGRDSPVWQMIQSQWLFMIFLILGFVLMLYRRFFMPDVLVVKVRNKKYEDFIDSNRMPKVE